jgi:hypothetical protein
MWLMIHRNHEPGGNGVDGMKDSADLIILGTPNLLQK